MGRHYEAAPGAGACALPLPRITLAFHAPGSPDQVYVAGNASAPWPLQVGGRVERWLRQEDEGSNFQALRDFFDGLRSVRFDFVVRSQGWGTGPLDRYREVCIVVRR